MIATYVTLVWGVAIRPGLQSTFRLKLAVWLARWADALARPWCRRCVILGATWNDSEGRPTRYVHPVDGER